MNVSVDMSIAFLSKAKLGVSLLMFVFSNLYLGLFERRENVFVFFCFFRRSWR